jgi:hypothetical protein
MVEHGQLPGRRFEDAALQFRRLIGIIFGSKTAAEDKRKIMRIIAEKCKAESRPDFEFHQMQYSRRNRGFRSRR